MEKLTDQYSELDREVLLNNRDSINVFLEFGKKWGLFEIIKGTERMFSNPGALDCLGYYVAHLSAQKSPSDARQMLQKFDLEMEKSPDGQNNFTKLKKAVIESQRENFNASLSAAKSSGDAASQRSFQYELDKLKINESDLAKGTPIDLYGFDSISPSLLPTWLLVMKANKILPGELQEMLGPDTASPTVEDPQITGQMDQSHQQALSKIKPV